MTHRRYVAYSDAHYAGNLVDGAYSLRLFGDVATEMCIRTDGDEGLFASYSDVQFLAPVRAGDVVEVTCDADPGRHPVADPRPRGARGGSRRTDRGAARRCRGAGTAAAGYHGDRDRGGSAVRFLRLGRPVVWSAAADTPTRR